MVGDASLVVRVATLDDVAALARLRYEWRARERGEGGLDERSFRGAFTEWMREHQSTQIPFLALRDGAEVGMAWLALVDGVPGPELFTRRSAQVKSVFVVARERSSGVGTVLMDHVVAHARELGLSYLVVHPSQRSFDFYRRLGFADSSEVLELRF